MRSQAIRHLQRALGRVTALGMTQRHQEMRRASSVYWGLQYDHLPDWHDAKAKHKPLREKAPAVQYRLTYRAINEINSHLFGKGRKPIPNIEGDADDDTRESLHEFYNSNRGGTGLKHHLDELGRLGLLHGQAVIAFHKRTFGGQTRFSTEVSHTKMCEPTFGRERIEEAVRLGIDDDELIELDEYWYSVDIDELTGEELLSLNRRLWTVDETVEFEPIPMKSSSGGPELDWRRDDERTVRHELGFVPAEWVRNVEVAGDKDGASLLSEAEFKVEDAVNYQLSQLDRGVAYNQEPLTAFLGANISGDGAIQRGAGNTIRLPAGPGGQTPDAKLLELEGTGQETAMAFVRMLRDSFYDIAHVVQHDPERAAQAISGVAMEKMFRPTIGMVDKIRPNYGRGVSRLLRKMLQADGRGEVDVSMSWPEIFEPTAQDVMQYQTAAIQGMDSGLITERTAQERVAPFYGIDDIEAYRREQVGQGTLTAQEDEDEPFGVEEL